MTQRIPLLKSAFCLYMLTDFPVNRKSSLIKFFLLQPIIQTRCLIIMKPLAGLNYEH